MFCLNQLVISSAQLDICSHGRAHKLFIESLSPNSCFEGIQCASYAEIKKEKCTPTGPSAIMGGENLDVLLKARGIYYVKTNNQSPYATNFTAANMDEVYYM